MDKDILADWANMLQEGIDCLAIANTLKEGERQKMYFDRGMDHLKKLRSEILQAKHCTISGV